MHSFTAYGLVLASALPLPGLLPGLGRADVSISLGSRADIAERDDLGIVCCRATPNQTHLIWGDVGELLIEGGTSILVRPAAGADEETLGLFVLGAGMGVLLHQRGLLVLHGSGVLLNDRAVGFLGPKGWGKSTTASALNRRGHALISEELLAIRFDSAGNPMVLPVASAIKLWSDSLDSFTTSKEHAVPVRPGSDKFYVAPLSTTDRECPLERLYLLAAGETLSLESIAAGNAFFGLVPHIYVARFGTSYLQATGCVQTFRQLNLLLRKVAVVRLLRQQDLGQLNDIASLVESQSARSREPPMANGPCQHL